MSHSCMTSLVPGPVRRRQPNMVELNFARSWNIKSAGFDCIISSAHFNRTDMTDLFGQYLGRYYLSERLGEGGMAVVYKAYDSRLERDVAIKIIRRCSFPADALGEVLKRFEREAKSLAKLSHPNIVKVPRDGVYAGRYAEKNIGQAHPLADRTAAAAAGCARGGICPPARHRASGYQADKHPDHRKRRPHALGFWDCQTLRRGPDDQSDRHWDGSWHA